MEDAWPFNDDEMQMVFDRLKIKNVSWIDVKNYAENYTDQYKDDYLQENITLEIIQAFDDVFYWGDYNITFESAKHKLIDWIRKHKQFYNDDLEITHQRMVETIAIENAKLCAKLPKNAKWTNIPYINWLPGYGGMIRGNRSYCEAQFHKKKLANKFFLPKNPFTPDKPPEESDDSDGIE